MENFGLTESDIDFAIAEYMRDSHDFFRRYRNIVSRSRTKFIFAAGTLVDAKAIVYAAYWNRFGRSIKVDYEKRPHTDVAISLLRQLDFPIFVHDKGKQRLDKIVTTLDPYKAGGDEKEPFSKVKLDDHGPTFVSLAGC